MSANVGSLGDDDLEPHDSNNAPHSGSAPQRIDTAGEDSKTAFHIAVDREDWKQAESLLSAARDGNAFATLRDDRDRTALHKVACSRRSDIFFARLLIEKATDKNQYVTAQNNMGETALHEAAFARCYNIAILLIENASDKNKFINVQCQFGETALHRAASGKCSDIAALLINNVMDKDKLLTARNRNGETALHHAANAGCSDIAMMLVENALDKDNFITVQDSDGWTALHEAASHEHMLPVLEKLLENTQNKRDYIDLGNKRNGRTALHQAVLSDSVDTVLFLLKEGARTTLLDMKGNTAWALACTPGEERWDIITTLLLKEPEFRDILYHHRGWRVIHNNNMAEVNRLLREIAKKLLDDTRLSPESQRLNFQYILRQVRQEFHENQGSSPYRATREPSCIFQTLDDRILTSPGQKDFISLVMPFIYIGTETSNEDREAEHSEQTKSLRYCLSKDRKFLEYHTPLTLDEYCSPALPQTVLDARNKDQVLSRYERSRQTGHNPAQTPPKNSDVEKGQALFDELWTLGRAYVWKLWHLIDPQIQKWPKRQQPEEIITVESDSLPKNAVLIHQVWIWKIGDNIIATVPNNTYEVSNMMQKFQDKHDGIAILLKHFVEHFGSPKFGNSESILRIYETVLSAISENVNEYVKSVLIEDIDIDIEKDFFHQISDFREELSMIKSVLAEQEEVWIEFVGLRWPNQRLDQQQGYRQDVEETKQQLSSGTEEVIWREICRPRALFNKYRRRIAKLEEDAERVERNIATKLDLKQKHAAMREAHSTAVISAAVFGFTIITIIFAPLSFIAALFALPIDEFNKGKMENDKDGVYSSAYIGKWSVATEFVSIAITLLTMWAAVRYAGLHVWGKKGVREWIRQRAKDIRAAERQTQHETSNANESDGAPRRRTLGDIVRRKPQGIPNPPMPEP
ncbi:hypothetical protein F4679DRAFT_583429 [Xylaria curta]|nr:hypothetical protein F4679DRAFT_583429 [Xylaria curta]